MLITEALDFKKRAFISLVGAGGKSTLFALLAHELNKKKKKIILTTTTHMLTRQLTPFITTKNLIETDDEKTMENNIKKKLHQNINRKIVLIHHRIKEEEGEKVSGPSPNYLDKWWKEELADYFLVEADGARGRPVKAPASHEPVIPLSTTDLIGVVGIDALNLPLQEENVFRSEIFFQITGLNFREKIGIEALSLLICHPEGLFKGVPQDCRCHLFINKVDDSKGLKMAEELAFQVLKICHQKISDITIGAACQEDNPVNEVIRGIK
ncbi:MAG: selenium cofactor biosynthesis protein YqeC [Candidatus Caldatribacteriota bacterium]|nr:selenium cofactor biosynthesis protein YqeC [Candidatus Caldatribacteriota bacterium]